MEQLTKLMETVGSLGQGQSQAGASGRSSDFPDLPTTRSRSMLVDNQVGKFIAKFNQGRNRSESPNKRKREDEEGNSYAGNADPGTATEEDVNYDDEASYSSHCLIRLSSWFCQFVTR